MRAAGHPIPFSGERRVLWIIQDTVPFFYHHFIMLEEVFLPTIEAYLKNSDDRTWLFKNQSHGVIISAKTIELIFDYAYWNRYLQKGGIHGGRHRFATQLLEKGTMRMSCDMTIVLSYIAQSKRGVLVLIVVHPLW